MFIELVMPSSHLILCHPLLLLPSIPPSIRVFSNESTLCMRWPKYWSFSFSISPSKEHPGLISFRMDWLYLLAVQGTLKSLLQHHNSKASILQRSAFFTVQLSHPYMTTAKTIALTRRLSPKCSLCNSTYVWLCLEGKPHKHTGSDGNRRQCLHGIATGGFFGQQYFRDAYRVCPESRKDMPSAMKHCQP